MGVGYPPIALDRASSTPLYRQVESELRSAILDGRLRPGVALPGMRAFARHLGVAAVTVMTAYEQLAAEGYLESRSGSGTVVAPDLPDRTVAGATPAAWQPNRSAVRLPEANPLGPTKPFFPDDRPSFAYDFTTGSTNLDLFPHRTWERALRLAWRDLSSGARRHVETYTHPAGDEMLREQLATYLGASRAVHCDPEAVVITAGAQAAFAVANQIWLTRGRRLVVEEPGSPYMQRSFVIGGTAIVHARVDDRGLVIDELPDAQGVLVTPSWQYPAGGTLPVARRIQLLAWAERSAAIVIEDDCDSELRYAGRPLPALQGLDSAGRVLYVGTFSKVLFPGLRVGYAVPPASARELFVARTEALYRGPGAIEQRALAHFMAEGHFHRHLGRLRAAFLERQSVAVAALERALGSVLVVNPAPAGTHLLVRIEVPDVSATAMARRAAHLGVGIEPLSWNRRLPAPDREFLFQYTRHRPAELERGVELLAKAFHQRASAIA